MKAIIVTKWGHMEVDVKDIPTNFKVVGYTEDLSQYRDKGGMVCREELDNQPIIDGFHEPMWDGGRLRYETYEVYNELSI